MKAKIYRAFKKLKWSLDDQLFAMGLKQWPKAGGKRRILVYHGVTADARTDINSRFISTSTFEQQLSYFKESCHLVSLADYYAGATHPDKMTLAITFDDGYANNLYEALPLLEKYQLPATFFITTIRAADFNILWADATDLYRMNGPEQFTFQGQLFRKGKQEYQGPDGPLKPWLKEQPWEIKKALVDQIIGDSDFQKDTLWKPYWQLLTENEIQTLAASPVASIGSHALYHNCLDLVDEEAAEHELTRSKSYLENLIQKEVVDLAYPDGRYTRSLVDKAANMGYSRQLAVDFRFADDQEDSRLAERFGINPYLRFHNQIQCLIDGKY